MNKQLEELYSEIAEGKLVQGTLSSPFVKSAEEPFKVVLRPIEVKGKLVYQASEFVGSQAMHKNYAPNVCVDYLQKLLSLYRQGIITTTNGYYHLTVGKDLQLKIKRKAVAQAVLPMAHNRKKRYLLEEGDPIPFLVALGVMGSDGKVHPKKYDKFRQINRFCEMVRDICDALPKGRAINIVDFGCGKAYLTFALHYYLHVIEGREVNILGLDLKKEVIEDCGALAKRLGLKGLVFAVADINTFEFNGKADLVISLHACDTATDAALEKAVRWGAEVIMCVPCCQHELYSQVKSDPLESLLRHGILRERFAALATDAARAEYLAMLGYDVQVLEFIEMEHTPKNLLLRGVKSASKAREEKAAERYREFKSALGITPSIEKRFPEAADRSGS